MITEAIGTRTFVHSERVIAFRLHRDVKYQIAYSFDPGTKYFYLAYVKDSKLLWHSLAAETVSSASFWQYLYCKHVKDRRLMYEALLKKPMTHAVRDAIYHYCLEVKDREELWQRLVVSNNPYYQYLYCLYVKDRIQMRNALANSLHIDAPKYQYLYCLHIKDRDMMWKALISHNCINYSYKVTLRNYIQNCKPRPEVIKRLAYVEKMLELKRRCNDYRDFVQIPGTLGLTAT